MPEFRIIPPVAPSLPVAQPGQEGLLNTLRLFSNSVANALRAILNAGGGQYIDCPYGLFFSTTSQTLAAINTATDVTTPTTYLSNFVTVSGSEYHFTAGGVYNFQLSAQLTSTNSSAKDVYLWINRNGTDIGYSTHVYTISGSGTNMVIQWDFNIDVQSGQYIKLLWAASDVNVTLTATAATAPHPGIPSVVMAINFVAPLPETLPTPP